jgi:acid phosphatase
MSVGVGVRAIVVVAHLSAAALSDSIMKAPRILAVGDAGVFVGRRRIQLRQEVAAGLANAANATDPLALLTLGDNIYEKGAMGNADNIVDGWQAKFPIRYPSLRRSWYVIAGNHDWYTNPKVEVEFTESEQNTARWWVFPYFWYSKRIQTELSNVTVDMFFIDTMIWNGEGDSESYFGESRTVLKSKQVAWLETRLLESIADWKVVVGHHPLYSIGPHHSGAYSSLVDLDELLQRHRIPIYLNGHNHNQQVVQYRGTTYITTGNGAKTACGGDEPLDAQVPPSSLVHFSCEGGFVGLTFETSETARLHVYDKAGDATRPGSSFVLRNLESTNGEVPETTTTMAPPTTSCLASKVQRRRRDGSCSCRRRSSSSSDLAGGWICRGEAIVSGQQDIATIPSTPRHNVEGRHCAGVLLEGVGKWCSGGALCNAANDTGADCCKVVPAMLASQTCDDYCGKNGLACVAALWEDSDATDGGRCTGNTTTCNQVNNRMTENLICQCTKENVLYP